MRLIAPLLVALLAATSAAAVDPFPVRRELLPTGRDHSPAGQDALIRLTRDEFEKRLAAAMSASDGRDAPRFIAARYSARLDGNNLVGQARWTVRHATPQPILWRLSPWGLAWRSAAWADGGGVVAGKVEGGDDVQLLVTKSGDRELTVDWSLRGRDTPAGLLFDLRVPPCPTGSWEFDLPGAEAYWPDDPAALRAPDGSSIWRAQAKSSARLIVRPRGQPAPPVNYLLRTDSQIAVSPGLAEASIDLDLSFVRDRQAEASITIDPALDVAAITGDSLRSWKLDGQKNSVRLHFAGAQSQAKLRVVGRTSLTSGQPWSAPFIRPIGGNTFGETAVIAVAPGVQLDDWRSGALQLISQSKRPDGFVELSLSSDAFRTEAGRPSCRPVFLKPFFDVTQHLRWRIEPDEQTLTADVTWQPFIGPMTRAALALSSGWEVATVEGVNGLSAPGWQQGQTAGRPTLWLEWPSVELSKRRAVVRLRKSSTETLVPIPDLFPVDARSRQVTLDAWISPEFDADLASGSSLVPATLPNAPDAPSARWLGRSTPLDGRLILRTKLTRFTVRGEGTIAASRGSFAVEHRLLVTPSSGALRALTLWCNDPAPTSSFTVSGPARLAAARRLPSPALGGSFAATSGACALAAIGINAAGGSWWLVKLAEPTLQPFTVTISSEPGRVNSPAAAWAGSVGGIWPQPLIERTAAEPLAPLWTAPAAAQQEHTLAISDSRIQAWQGHGNDRRAVTSMNYRDQPTYVTVAAAPGTAGVTVTRQFTMAGLADGSFICCCDCLLDRWSGGEFQLHLPGDAVWLGASFAGKELSATVRGELAKIHTPAGDNVRVKAFITVPGPGSSPANWLNASSKQYYPNTIDAPIVWALPRGVVALEGESVDAPDIDWPLPTLPANSVVTAGPFLIVAQSNSVRFWTCVLTAAAIGLMLCWPRLAGRPGALFAAVLALAAIWLPGPLRPLALGPLLVVVLATAFRVVRPRFILRPAVAVGSLLLLVWSAGGADRLPTIIYILPAIGDAPEAALVPRAFLDELDRAVRRGSPDGVLTLSADYQAEVVGDTVRIVARWQVHAFQDQATWEFPTRGLQLADVRVNDHPAYPTIGDDHSRISLSGTGRFTIEAKCIAGVVGRSEDRSVRIPVPEAPATRLSLRLTEGASVVETPGVGAASIKGQVVEVDCGLVRELQVRWRERPAKLAGPVLQQAWLWDLAAPAAHLFGVVKFELQPDSSRDLAWQLPPGLTMVSVRAVRDNAVIDWSQDADQLVVRLNPATRGDVTLLAELVAFEPLSPNQPLPFPTADGRGSVYLAWRGDDSPGAVTAVETVAAELLTREFFAAAGLEQLTPTHAYRKLNPRSAIRVIRSEAGWHGSQNFAWRLRPRRAELTTTAVLTAKRAGRLVEWEMPPTLNVESVSGDGVRYWSKTAGRLQVWLDSSRTAAAITWRGSVNRSSETARFDTPIIRLAQSDVDTALQVDAGSGWDLTPIAVMRAATVPGADLIYRAEKPNYRLVLQPEPWAKQAVIRVITDVTIADDIATTKTTVSVTAANGLVRRFGLILPSTDGDVKIEAPAGHVRELPEGLDRRQWVVDPQTPQGETCQLTLTTRSNVAGLTAWSPPLAVVNIGQLRPSVWEHQLRLRVGGWEIGSSDSVRWDTPNVGYLTSERAFVRLHTVTPSPPAPTPPADSRINFTSRLPLKGMTLGTGARWAATLLLLAFIGPIISWLPGRDPNKSLDGPASADKVN